MKKKYRIVLKEGRYFWEKKTMFRWVNALFNEDGGKVYASNIERAREELKKFEDGFFDKKVVE